MTVRCKCGAGKRKPCKNKLANQPRQTLSLQQQFTEMEVSTNIIQIYRKQLKSHLMLLQAFVAGLSTEQLHARILCGHGGVDLDRSLLRSGQDEPDLNPIRIPVPPGLLGVCAKSALRWTQLKIMYVVETHSVSQTLKLFS